MPKMDGMTLYRKIKEIDDSVIVCISLLLIKTIFKNYKKAFSIMKKLLYTNFIILRNLKNKIDSLLLDEESKSLILTN